MWYTISCSRCTRTKRAKISAAGPGVVRDLGRWPHRWAWIRRRGNRRGALLLYIRLYIHVKLYLCAYIRHATRILYTRLPKEGRNPASRFPTGCGLICSLLGLSYERLGVSPSLDCPFLPPFLTYFPYAIFDSSHPALYPFLSSLSLSLSFSPRLYS